MGARDCTLEFLRALWSDEPLPGSLVVWTRSRQGEIASTWCRALNEAAEVARRHAERSEVFFGVALQDPNAALTIARRKRGSAQLSAVRGSSASATAIPCFWMDIDIQSPAHSEPNLPPDLPAALSVLEALPQAPTMIVTSGYGIHAYWLFREAWTLDSDKDRSRAEQILSRLQLAVRGAAAKRGWKLDATGDLARLLRLPGTFNYKLGERTGVAIHRLAPDVRYNPEEFGDLLPELAAERPAPSTNETRNVGSPAQIEPILESCAWLRHCRDDRETLPEPEWYAMLGIVGRCASPDKSGPELAHEWSEGHPGYTSRETDQKLEQALRASGPRTCRHIAGELGARDAYCGTCLHYGEIKSPITLGRRLRKQEKPSQRKRRQVVLIGNDEKRVNDQARAALSGHPDLFRRGDLLVHIVQDESPREHLLRAPGAPRIVPVPESLLREMLAERVDFRRRSGKEKPVEASPPQACIRAIAAQGNWPELRALEGLTETPMLFPDGSILQKPGFDTSTGLFLIPRSAYPRVPARPTRVQVHEAVKLLREAVCDFPFAHERHVSASLAALLTIQGRYAFSGPAPCILLDANTRGCGKGLLVSVVAQIATGRPVARMPYSRDPEEQRKTILSLALQGERVVLFDNVAGTFGSAILDAALTAPDWSDRLLGVSRAVRVPLSIVWFATGNNVAVVGDTVRRCLLIRLESPEEHPERRTGFRYPRLLDWVTENQGSLAVAGLTLLRAYFEAGRPDQHLAAWGSYEGWSDLVRNCLVWLGLPDPGDTREDLYESASSEGEALHNLIAGLQELFENLDGRCGTAREILAELASARPERYVQLREALAELVLRPGSGDLPTARQLGEVLKRYRGRVLGDRVIERAQERKTKRGVLWCVEGSSGDAGASGDSDSPGSGKSSTTWREEVPAWGERESPGSPESPEGGLQRWRV